MTGATFVATVDCFAVASLYSPLFAHAAVIAQVPAPEVMVTVLPLIEQGPVDVMVGVIGALDVAVIMKLVLNGAEAGAPVKVTV